MKDNYINQKTHTKTHKLGGIKKWITYTTRTPTTKHTAFAKNGMVATSQPLAAQAGIEIMRQGGNAIDAAIATAAALTVVEPTSNGIGGDAFALVWVNNKLHGLNASGPSPEALTINKVTKAAVTKKCQFTAFSITVSGAPAAWAELSKKFGKLSLKESLAPAIRYAEEGYPLTPILGKYWKIAYKKFSTTFTTEELTLGSKPLLLMAAHQKSAKSGNHQDTPKL